jgi:hypothetical protein
MFEVRVFVLFTWEVLMLKRAREINVSAAVVV